MQEYPKKLQESKSLLAKYLTAEVFTELKNKRTKNGFSLSDVIQSGLDNPDSSIGAYAGDEESYECFAALFDPIIQEYHNFSKTDKHRSNFNPLDLHASNPDIEGKYILSTRIRVGRNIKGIPLGASISKEQRLYVEKKVSQTLKSFNGNLSGTYYSLETLSKEDRARLISEHFLFKAGDRFLESAGLNRDWPSGRGIFHNDKKTFLVWVNEEDELRVISMQKGGDIQEVFARLSSAIEKLQEQIDFAYSEHLGYISSCPTNLGTAMRASVHIKLPLLSKRVDEFEAIAEKHNVQIRGIDGEHSESEGGVFDISNKHRLGVSEVECVQEMYNGVVALMQRERELEL